MLAIETENDMIEYIRDLKGSFEYEGEMAVWMLPGVFGPLRDHAPEFQNFIRRCIIRLLEIGAVPVRGAEDGPYHWLPDDFLGKTHDEIADMMIAELLPAEDPTWVNIWFVKARQVGR